MDVLGNRFGIRKPNPPPFLVKTYLLVEEPSTDAVISWNANGTAFVVWHPAEFARDLLPTLFKHSNFSSFIRQLNTYGFRKVATSRWEFCNDMFQKGKRELLGQIRRRKAWAHRSHPKADKSEAAATSEVETDRRSSSSTSSSEHMSSLSDENKRLRWENGMLSSELSSMKNKCNELLDLAAMYTRSEPVMMIGGGGCVKEEKEDADDKRMKLFGVRLDLSGQGGNHK